MPDKTQHKALTPWNYACLILPRLATSPTAPVWPPDVFAICISLLQKFAAYTKVLSYWPREDETVETWAKKAYRLGSNWRQTCASSGTVPVEVRNRWNAARELLKKVSFGASDNLKLYQLLLELAAIADEACVGVGLPSFRCNAARTACKTAWAGAAGKLAFFAGLSTNRSRRAAYLTSDPSDQANRGTGISRTPPSPAGRWGCLGRHLSRV